MSACPPVCALPTLEQSGTPIRPCHPELAKRQRGSTCWEHGVLQSSRTKAVGGL